MTNTVGWDDSFEEASFGQLEGMRLRVTLRPSGLWWAEIGDRDVKFPADTTSREQAKAWCMEAARKLVPD